MQRTARAATAAAGRQHPQAPVQMRTAGMLLQSRCGISCVGHDLLICQGLKLRICQHVAVRFVVVSDHAVDWPCAGVARVHKSLLNHMQVSMQVPRSGGSISGGSSDDDDDVAPARQRLPSRGSPASPAPRGAADAAELGERLDGPFASNGEAPAARAPVAGQGGSLRGGDAAAAAAALRKRLLKKRAARAAAPAVTADGMEDADDDDALRATARAAEQPARAESPAGSGNKGAATAAAPARKQLLKRSAAGALPPAAPASEMEDADAGDTLRPAAGAREQLPKTDSPPTLGGRPRMRAGHMLSSSDDDSGGECSGSGGPKRRLLALVSKRARHAPADGEADSTLSPGARHADPADAQPYEPDDEDMAADAQSTGSGDATPKCRHSGGTLPAHSGGTLRAKAHSPAGSGMARKRSRSSKLPNKRPKSGAPAAVRSSPSSGSGPVGARLGPERRADEAAAAPQSPDMHRSAPMELAVERASDSGSGGAGRGDAGGQDVDMAAGRGVNMLPAMRQRNATAAAADLAQQDGAAADALPLGESGVPEQQGGGAGDALTSSAPVAGATVEDASLGDRTGLLLRGLGEEAEARLQASDENRAPLNTPGCDAPVLCTACLLQQAFAFSLRPCCAKSQYQGKVLSAICPGGLEPSDASTLNTPDPAT